VSDVLDMRTDEGFRRALRDVTSAGSWDCLVGRRLLCAVRDRAARNAAHVAGATGARCDRNLVDDVMTAAWVVLDEHTDRVLAAERPWAYVMRSAQQEVMAEALAERAVTSRTTASGRHRQHAWKVLVARVGAAAGQVAATLGHSYRGESTAEQPAGGALGTAYRRGDPVLVERPHEPPSATRVRDGWYAAFIGLLVGRGADGPVTTAAVDHLADLFSVTPSKQWETAARHDPVLARLGLSPDQRSALVALLAGSRRDREAGRRGGLLQAVRAAQEHGTPVTLSAADRKRVRTYVAAPGRARRRPPAEQRLPVATEAVRAEMARKGVTQDMIATRLGLRRQNVSTRLSGIVAWTPEELATVADLLTVPMTRLLHNRRQREKRRPVHTMTETGRTDAITGTSDRLLALHR
jgi:hypothetical protein